MKSYLSLALKELKAQKMTSVLILIAVILSTIMTTVVGQSIGILQTMRINQAASLNGDRYVTFHQLTEEQEQLLSEDSRLTSVGSLINIGNTVLENSNLTLYLREYTENALDIYPSISKIKSGRLPEYAGEIALPEDALEYLGVDGNIGDKISLSLEISLRDTMEVPYEYHTDFTLCGILENNYIGYGTGMIDGIVGNGTAKAILPEQYQLYSTDFKTDNKEQFQNIVLDLAEKLSVPKSNIQYNGLLLEAIGIDYEETDSISSTNTGFSFMKLSFVLVGVLVLFAAGLVIYNILKIAVAKRIRQYGTLRAIGAEKRQLYSLVTIQLLFLCGIGIPIGIVGGVLSSQGILSAAMSFFNPDLFMASSTQELTATIRASTDGGILPIIVSVMVTLLFSFVAAFPAARYASMVSPTVAMSGQSLKIKRRNRKAKKIRNFEAFYARLNLKRSRGRTAITILSMVMSITVFVSLQSFSSLLDTSAAIQKMYLGDYAVTSETVGMTAEAVSELSGNDMVDSLSTTQRTIYTQNESGILPVDTSLSLQTWETLHMIGIDDERLISYVSGLTDTDKNALLTGTACLVKNPIPLAIEGENITTTELSVGEEIKVGNEALRIVGIINEPITVNNEGFINGVQLIVCNSAYEAITGQTAYTEVYPVLAETADTQQFEDWLDEWCNKNVGSHWLSYRQVDEQLAESFSQINMLCWGLILFIGLIGVLNIINTVYTNIHTRISEIGVQRAIGMSKESLYKTFLWEGAYYGLIASVIGGLSGYCCSVFIGAAVNNTLQFGEIPLIAIFEATAISVVACMFASAIPLRSIAKADIVKSISAIE